jgi:hypothetical protein
MDDFNDAWKTQELEDKMKEQQRREEQALVKAQEEEADRQKTLNWAKKNGLLKK